MDKTKAIRISVEEELLHDHLDEIKEHYGENAAVKYYTVISDEQIRKIVRDELKNLEMEKMYND